MHEMRRDKGQKEQVEKGTIFSSTFFFLLIFFYETRKLSGLHLPLRFFRLPGAFLIRYRCGVLCGHAESASTISIGQSLNHATRAPRLTCVKRS